MSLLVIVTMGLCVLTESLFAARTCRVVYPERPREAPKVAFIFDGKSSQQITLPSMNLSEVIDLPDGDLTIAMTAKQIDDPKALPADTPLLKIPHAIRDFYIIVSPDPENTQFPVKMNLVDTGAVRLMPGQTLWFNLTGHRIVAKMGETKLSVEPNGKTISEDPLPASGYYTAQIAYQANGNGPVAPITKQRWWHDANSRHLGFIVGTGGKLPKLYYYRDFRIPREVIEAARKAAQDDPPSTPEDEPPTE